MTARPAAPLQVPVVTVAEVKGDSVTFSWSDAGPEESYVIERMDVGQEGWHVLHHNVANRLDFIDNSVVEDKLYVYRVKAIDPQGAFLFSAASFVSTPQPPPPNAPQGVLAKVLSASEIGIYWDSVADADKVLLEQRSSGQNNWSLVANLSATHDSYLSYGLSAGTEYYYRLASKSQYGVSQFSEIVQATPVSAGAGSAPTGSVLSLTVEGPDFIDEDAEFKCVCLAHFHEGISRDVTAWATWNTDSDFATLKNHGILVSGSVTDDVPCTILVDFGGFRADHTTTVVNVDGPEFPVILTQRNKERIDPGDPLVAWTDYEGATWYRIVVMLIGSGGEVAVDSIGSSSWTATSTFIVEHQIQPGTLAHLSPPCPEKQGKSDFFHA